MKKKIICLLIVSIFFTSASAVSTAQNKSNGDFGTLNVSNNDLPNAFSWTDFRGDWTTMAKDHHYGYAASYAFSAIGALEAAINIQKNDSDFDLDLSEQYIFSCLKAAGNFDRGGYVRDAIKYIESTRAGSIGNGINGCPLETCMIYQAVDWIPCDDKCPDWDYYTVPPEGDNILWQIEDYGYANTDPRDPEDWNIIKTLIIEHGPVAADMYMSSGLRNFWNSHHSPTDVYDGVEVDDSNYRILICGWVDDTSVHNGGYWILKNSMGSGWGYSGFANIAYGCNNIGDEEVVWVEAIDWPNEDPPDPYDDYLNRVYAGWDYEPKELEAGDLVNFYDESRGPVVIWEWDLDGDGISDVSGAGSHARNPEWTYDYGGVYEVKQQVWSSAGLNSHLIRPITVIGENVPPNAPEISGDPEIVAGEESTFTFVSKDNNGGDRLYYYIDWGDGNSGPWIGPYNNNEEAFLDHIYQKGTYQIVCKSKDQLDAESEESSFEVTVSKSKAKMLFRMFERSRFQFLLRILNL
jgi:hypothetical protein